jgi:hypothetical protein
MEPCETYFSDKNGMLEMVARAITGALGRRAVWLTVVRGVGRRALLLLRYRFAVAIQLLLDDCCRLSLQARPAKSKTMKPRVAIGCLSFDFVDYDFCRPMCSIKLNK